jgi:putative oxygen-independent coproporphyrinogen III oxidase
MAFGVYVHIPFCESRCGYCAFATWTDRAHLMDAYTRACIAEIDAAALPPATSVFFGGGTPSLLRADLLVSILDAIPRAPGCEITVECNPSTVHPDLLASYRAHGVNRLSFGAQSMVPSVLATLERDHDPAAVLSAVEMASDFPTWNVDLIYGSFGERCVDWRYTLDVVLGLQPPHVSAYALTVEPGTPLAANRARYPDDDDMAAKYVVGDARLREAGLINYEISNWARPGHECRHNMLYWRQGNYRGIGCAAHSHDAGHRWWNVRTPDRYIELIGRGESVVAGSEQLDDDERRVEGLQLALRTASGVPSDALDDLGMLAARGLVASGSDDRVVLTVEGRMLANEVALRLR